MIVVLAAVVVVVLGTFMGEADHPENLEPDLENHLPDDSYPMQDSDIEDLLEHMVIIQSKWHPHITSPSTHLPPMGL